MKKIFIIALLLFLFFGCKKNGSSKPPVILPFTFTNATINNIHFSTASIYNINLNPVIEISFSAPIDTSTIANYILLTDANGIVSFSHSYSANDTSIIIQPNSDLKPLTGYTLSVFSGLKSITDSVLKKNVYLRFVTAIDSTDKFPQISDSALLTLVQQQTFKYFWDNANPVSYMARERNSDATTDATGGTGFGVMATLVGVQRNFILRSDALAHISTLVNFLSTKATTYHGAFSHWINGTTGTTIPFTTQDDGGDIVETSYLMEGLLCARQYFNSTTDPTEINLRNNINTLWNNVDWNWYRQNNQNVLYWHWSPDYGFAINAQVQGWNEALIIYVLAASSPDSSVPKIVYDNGWANNGGMKNDNTYYGYTLPLGPSNGGPLFFEHYSFMGIDPKGLTDAYANYDTQTVNHTEINYHYCIANPHNYYGYSNQSWGLTASDAPYPINYNANEPNNDIGVIAPTAAISSLPYTPTESLQALRFFYYKLGDRLWKQSGFIDAFDLSTVWFDNDFLAIDQGPQIVMIENYRSGLLWNLFMSCPEIQQGMKNLGFRSPHF